MYIYTYILPNHMYQYVFINIYACFQVHLPLDFSSPALRQALACVAALSSALAAIVVSSPALAPMVTRPKRDLNHMYCQDLD